MRRLVLALLAADVVLAAVGMAAGEALHGKPDHFFREQAAGTYWSGVQLLLVAWTAARTASAARAAPRGSAVVASAWFFALAAAAFAFLAVDEVARLHEKLEDVLVAHEGPGPKPPFLDRIDDLIVLGYGVVAAGVLLRARARRSGPTPRRSRGSWRRRSASRSWSRATSSPRATTSSGCSHTAAPGCGPSGTGSPAPRRA